MKKIWFFIVTTIKGGLFFFLLLVFLVIAIEKAAGILRGFVSPIAEKLGIDNFAGRASLSILIGLIILLICFNGGLLMKIKMMKRFSENLEEILWRFFPHYKKLKTKGEQLKQAEEGI